MIATPSPIDFMTAARRAANSLAEKMRPITGCACTLDDRDSNPNVATARVLHTFRTRSNPCVPDFMRISILWGYCLAVRRLCALMRPRRVGPCHRSYLIRVAGKLPPDQRHRDQSSIGELVHEALRRVRIAKLPGAFVQQFV